ncbi:DUF7689 domain-containing protein [Azospirillum argentinense]|uniref:DUF7689 domain-containing protein n=1 Tax=Azospirillum argentinense TaxID=2970906 RepID=UPI0010BFD565|nr:hypothetical protein [Azospirillum argentinense]
MATITSTKPRGGTTMPYNGNSDWRTSKNNIASDFHWSGADDALAAHQQLKAEVERSYPGATVIGNATRTYNCHAFVHASSHAWFNDIGPFLRDDYFPFTPGTLRTNDAVVYVKDGQITHSGFITQLSGNTILRVRSKWGAYPLVEHPPTSVPAIYGNITYYLRRRQSLTTSEAQMSEHDENGVVSKLLSSMLDSERLKDLWLASTPDVAEMIVKNWPEFSEIQLYGGHALGFIKNEIERSEGDKFLVLSIIAHHLNDPELSETVRSRKTILGY